jgi:tetratricopeptide (TPR) repeat protein
MSQNPVCPRCAEPVPPNETDCPYCAGRMPYPFWHREPVLITAILALAVALWLITHGVTQAYGHRQDHLARTWYANGETALREGRLDEAISDLRTALAYSHDGTNVRLRLAEALAAAGQVRQARAYLLALWEERPGDGTVNLQLARLAARSSDFLDAERYYHGAIYGIWDDDPMLHRRQARLELIGFLLSRHANQQAQSELIALSADLPRDPDLMREVAQLFLAAGDPNRALTEYHDVVQLAPHDAAALAGAGQAAFQLKNYSLARDYLSRAVALDKNDAHSAQLLQASELVLQLDPYVALIGGDERSRRVLRALEQTQYRLETCAAQKQIVLTDQPPSAPLAADYAELLDVKSRVNVRTLRADPDLIDAAMEQVVRSQTDAAAACGQPEGADQALLLIARAHGGRP